MNGRHLAWMVAGMLPLAAGGQPAAEGITEILPVEGPVASAGSVISRSEQFRISGGTPMIRGAVAILIEDAKDDFLHLLGEIDSWKIPVSVVLHGNPGDPAPPRTVATRLWVVEGVQQLQLDKHLGPGVEVERLKRAVTSVLIYERSLRAMERAPGEGEDMRVPTWLVMGMREASAWRMQQSDRDLYATLFRQGSVFRPEELFDLGEPEFAGLDGASRAAYRVAAGALVMALLEQPQGREGFRDMLAEVASYQGEVPILLRRHFPELNLSKNSLAKWWALQLATKGDLNLLTDVMTVAETEERLARSLMLELPLEDGSVERVALDQWHRLESLGPRERAQAVKPAQTSMVQLSYRCFPSYRPLLVEYQKLLIRMTQDETGEVGRALRELGNARRLMLGKSQRGRDYLDWFEITRARETSGAFDDYLRLKEELKTRKRTRNDAISNYLDRMDALFDRSGEP